MVPETNAPTTDDIVTLHLSPAAIDLPITRLTVGAIAADAGLSVDVLEDIQLAVHEAVLLLRQPGGVDVACARLDGVLRIRIIARDHLLTPPPDDLGWLIITQLCSDTRMEHSTDTTIILEFAVGQTS